jgi:alpha-1,3-mannosyltransferase
LLTAIAPFDIVHLHGQVFIMDCLALARIAHGRPLVLSEYSRPSGESRPRSRLGDMALAPSRAISRLSYRRVFRSANPTPTPREADATAAEYVEAYKRILGAGQRTHLGVTLQTLRREQAISTIDQAFASGQRLNVGFVNAHSLNIATGNERYRSVLERFFVLNDGLGINIASRLKYGKPFAANLNGTDFVPCFLARTRHRLRIYLVGTTDAVVDEAARKMRLRFPRHVIVGSRNGFFQGPEDIEETCRTILASNADGVLVGMGNPLQEFWISEHGAKTGARLLLGVGALLDFQAGVVSRAPDWVRRLHCEWAYRLAQEPRRLAHRYLVGNFVFLGRALLDARR